MYRVGHFLDIPLAHLNHSIQKEDRLVSSRLAISAKRVTLCNIALLAHK